MLLRYIGNTTPKNHMHSDNKKVSLIRRATFINNVKNHALRA